MTFGIYVFLCLVFGCVGAVTGGVTASIKGRDDKGWAGLCFLFPFMIFPLFCLPNLEPPIRKKSCPDCNEMVNFEAKICRYCSCKFPEKTGVILNQF